MPARPWSKHRHWHDNRGRTHRQAPHVPPVLPAASSPPPQPSECWQCLAPIDPTTDRCRECGADTLPF